MHALLLAAALAASPPFTAVDKLGPESAARHVTGKELAETLQKGMTPEAFYSQVTLSRHDTYLVLNTARDKSGQAEIHDSWSDNIFIQEGEASLVTGGTAVDAKDTAPGEKRALSIKNGTTRVMRPGDYFFVPAGTPHQMILKSGQKLKFIVFKTHK
jgi:mannose-6-phosphate isomerase-like protein (cupin superfamily)